MHLRPHAEHRQGHLPGPRIMQPPGEDAGGAGQPQPLPAMAHQPAGQHTTSTTSAAMAANASPGLPWASRPTSTTTVASPAAWRSTCGPP